MLRRVNNFYGNIDFLKLCMWGWFLGKYLGIYYKYIINLEIRNFKVDCIILLKV